MDRDRFAEALMSFGDTVNNAFGGKQNIYGTYQEQKTKRMEQEAKAEAAALAARQRLYNQAVVSRASAGTNRPEFAVIDPTDPTGMRLTTQANPNYIAPIAPADTTLKEERQRYASAQMLPISREQVLTMNPMDRMNYLRDRDLVKTAPGTGNKYAVAPAEMRRRASQEIVRYDEAGASFNAADKGQIKTLESAYNRPVDALLKSGRVYEGVDDTGNKTFNVRSAEEYKNFKQPFSEKERESFSGRYDTLNSLSEVRNVLSELGDIPSGAFEVEMKNVDFGKNIGVFSIPANIKLSRQFEATADPKFSRAVTVLQSAIQAYRRAVSGQAVSEYEIKDLASVFPNLKDNPKVFLEKLGAIEDKGVTELSTRLDALEATGKDARGLRKQYDTYTSKKERGYATLNKQSGGQAPKLNKTQQSLYDRYSNASS